MSMTFSELVVCLLPGFLGLWVFKRIVQEDMDKRGESTQIAVALLLAMFSFFVLSLLRRLLMWWGCPCASWFSIDALDSSAVGARGGWGGGLKFWSAYGVLCVIALLSGGLWGFVSELGWSPTRFLPKGFSLLLKRGPKNACESSLRALVDGLNIPENGPPLVRVYTLGESAGKPLIGWWAGYSETEKEIRLGGLEFCDSVPNLDILLKMQKRCCWVNHNSGVVVEFVECDRESRDDWERYIVASYAGMLRQDKS